MAWDNIVVRLVVAVVVAIVLIVLIPAWFDWIVALAAFLLILFSGYALGSRSRL
jgi:phosphotransferase system  glucose/maltose/N-acetylglucosamine-specific IIC component